MSRWRIGAVCCAMIVSTFMPGQETPSEGRVKAILLSSRRMGPHGLSYNADAMRELGNKLRPKDIPVMLRLLKSEDLEVSSGAAFGLASQCKAAIDPVRRASEEPADMRRAEDVLDLIAHDDACSDEAKSEAALAKDALDEARKAYYQKRAEELAAERANDQRIQENGLKMLDPKQSKELTYEERLEVFKRSVKAAGLEDAKTPEQKALVDRMYRTMVLGEGDKKKKPN